MMVEIENAVVQHLEDNGLNVEDIDLDKKSGTAAKRSRLPACYVAIETGGFSRSSQNIVKCEANLLVAVAFKDFAGDRKRRRGAQQILIAIVQLLAMQKLDLDIRPLMPTRFYNITDKELADIGITAYQIEFGTGFDMQRQQIGQVSDLLTIGLQYYLQESEDDGKADAGDEITLSQ
jgi:hypothetical protein